MKLYIASLAAGLLVGIIYALLNVRSPAPPVVALVGLHGILLGEQIPPLARQLMQPRATDQASAATSWFGSQVKPHCFGQLPGADPKAQAPRSHT
jgi:XapX domain-containing protein